MEPKQINQLMLAMGRCGIKKLVLKKETFELHLEREERGMVRSFDPSLDLEENPMRQDFEMHRQTGVVAPHPEVKKQAGPAAEREDAMSVYITSPMVGTVYHSPSPNDPAFIKVGDRVEKNTVVCIVEAMKVMNEVKAGVAGTVAEIMVDNGQPVEFGTKIVRIVP
jgi:acetyl-CoA carboxylase biotin carboxyl carrier protein